MASPRLCQLSVGIALAAACLALPAPAMADYRSGWHGRQNVQNVRIHNTVIVRKERHRSHRNDHNRDALTNAALLKQSILLSRMNAGERCSSISKYSDCTTRGGARIVGAGR